MFKTKKDVDRHVRSAFEKLRSDNEKNSRGFTIAKLYFKINEYATAQHYITGYLSVNEECAPAHKLLGQCLQQLKKPDKALASYQRSLNLDPKQPDLLIEVCRLIVSDECDTNMNKAKYWCDLAESKNIHHDAVSSLRLKLLNKNSLETTQIEELILKEIAIRPNDPNLRVRIIKQYIEQNKISEAFKYAYDLEMKNHTLFSNCIDWYNIIWIVLTKYKQQPNARKSFDFWLLLMICVERQVDLSFTKPNSNVLSSGGTADIANLLFTFDQHLHEASQCVSHLGTEKELIAQFLCHFRGQLCLHAAALIYRREQVQNKNQWREAIENAMPLLLFAFHCGIPDTKENWLKHSGDKSRQLIQVWHREGSFRCAQVGRTLLSCVDNSRNDNLSSQVQNVMSDHSIWSSIDDILAQIRQYCSDSGWRTKLFRILFPTSEQLVQMQTSHLINCDQLAEPTYELPQQADIETYEEIAQYLRPQSLQHMVYLCMGVVNLFDVRCKYFNGLKFSTQNLSFCGAESLSHLDIETFLYATVIQAKRLYEVERMQYENYNAKHVSKPSVMPFANMSSNLCSEEQSNWWQAAYQVYKNLAGDNLAELRATLQYGIEAVRGVNGPKMDLIVVLKLGKLFVIRAQDATKPIEKTFLEVRAHTLYKFGLTMLKLQNKGVFPVRKLFKYSNTNSGSVERDITVLAEEAVTLIAARHFKNAEYEECIEELSGLQLPYATYFQAEAYRKLDESNKTPKKTKKLYSDKAKDCLNQTLNLLGCSNVDRNHPLNSVVHSEMKRMQYTDMFLNESENNEIYNNDEYLNDSFNRSRREVQNSLSAGKTTEIENLIKQMLSTLSFVKEELVEKIKPEVSEIKRDISALKENIKTIEENMKKSRPPSRDDTTNVLDDLYMIDELQPAMFSGYNQSQQQQRMQTPNAIINQPPIHTPHNPPVPPSTTNLYNSPLYNQIIGPPANPLLNQHTHHTSQFGGAAAVPNVYNGPLYNPNYPFNYYPQMMPQIIPPGTLNFGLQNQQQQQLMPPIENSPSLFELLTQPSSGAVASQMVEKPSEKPAGLQTNSVPTMWNRIYNNAPVEKGLPVNVVITSSDPLPAHTTVSTQSTLSVTIPPQHIKQSLVNDITHVPQSQQANTSFPIMTQNSSFSNNSFAAMNAITTAASTTSITSAISFAKPKVDVQMPIPNKVSESSDSEILNKSTEIEYDPRPDFQPIIPLPDEIEVKTGEENEEVLFCSRAKLLRHIEKEWKERGIGDIKILKNKTDDKIRILMRREQTHKICANHNITREMNLIQAKGDEKSYIWCANDFADEVLKIEKLCVRFKFVETAKEFQSAFIKAQKELKTTDSVTTAGKKTDSTKKVEKGITTSVPLAKSAPFQFAITTSTPTSKVDANKPAPVASNNPFESKPAFGILKNNELTKETKAPEITKASPFATFSFATPTSVSKTDSPFLNIFTNTQNADNKLSSLAPIVSLNTPKEITETRERRSVGEADEGDDYVPTAQFEPVIPLPDLVEVQTGEENERVMFEHRAKLLRFDKSTNEWKERGIGIMKVLVDISDPNLVRLVMRREQIFKLCCNQRLTKDMIFKYTANSENALTWCGQDYSENELQTEVLAVRFKTAEICKEFHSAILQAQKNMTEIVEDTKAEENKVENNTKSIPYTFGQSKEDTVIETVKLPSTTLGFGDKFKPKPGSWACDACYTSNTADSLSCVACERAKDGTVSNKPVSNKTLPKTNYTFGFGTSDLTKQVANTKPVEGFGDKFKSKPGSWSCKTCYVLNDKVSLYCEACNSPKDDTVPKKEPKNILGTTKPGFSFGFSPAAVDLSKPASVLDVSKPLGTGFDGSKLAPNPTQSFQFGNSGNFKFTHPTTIVSNASYTSTDSTVPFKFKMNNTTAANMFAVSGEIADSTTSISNAANPVFDLNQTASTIVDGKTENGFRLEKEFNFVMKPKSPSKARSPLKNISSVDDEADVADIEEENNTYFTPVIPLPDKVDVVTGEEDELQLYCHRAKLYRFTDSEWKERGIGDVKILRHKETKKLRVVMRREQVLKICLNHALTDDIHYKPKDEKSWHFVANDFSEGEIQSMVFSIRFKSKEISDEFMAAIKKALQEPTSIDESKESVAIAANTTNLSDELKNIADRLKLPYSFYENHETAKCSGCCGCDPDKFSFPDYREVNKDLRDENPLPLYMPELSITTPNKTILKQSILPTGTFSPKPDDDKIVKKIFESGSDIFSTPNGTTNKLNVSGETGTAKESKFVFSLGNTKSTEQENNESKFKSGGFLFGNSKTSFGNADKAKPVFGQTSIFGNANIDMPAPTTIFGNANITAPPAFVASSTDTEKNVFGNLNSKAKENEPFFGGKANFTFGTSGFAFGPPTKSGSIFGGGFTEFSGASNTDAAIKKADDLTTSNVTLRSGNSVENIINKNAVESTEPLFKIDQDLCFATLAENAASQTVFPASMEDQVPGGFIGLDKNCDFSIFLTSAKDIEQRKLNASNASQDNNVSVVSGEDSNYDPHYEPIIELPELINISTGEENEQKLFGERCTLYRYDNVNKEWKERGVGEIKILHHTEKGTYRLILRREQIHKLVLNHAITADFQLKSMNTSGKSFCWAAMNYAEDPADIERLAARFKNCDIANAFEREVNKCVEQVNKRGADLEPEED